MPRQAKNLAEVVASVAGLILVLWLAFDVAPGAFDPPAPTAAAVPAEVALETYQETERQAPLSPAQEPPAPEPPEPVSETPLVEAKPDPVEQPQQPVKSDPAPAPPPEPAATRAEPAAAKAAPATERRPPPAPVVPPEPAVADAEPAAAKTPPAAVAPAPSRRQTALSAVADRMITEVAAIDVKPPSPAPVPPAPSSQAAPPREHAKAVSKTLAAQADASAAPPDPVAPAEAAPTITQAVSRAEVDHIAKNQRTQHGTRDDVSARFLVENADRFEVYPMLGIRPHIWDPERGLLYDLDPVGRAARAGPGIIKIKLRGPNRSWFHNRHRLPISELLDRHYDSDTGTTHYRRFVYLYVGTDQASAYLARKNGDFLNYLRTSNGIGSDAADPWVTAVLFRLKANGKEVAAYFPLGAVVERNGRRAWLAAGIDFEKYLAEIDVDIGALAPANARAIIGRLKHARQAMRRKYS